MRFALKVSCLAFDSTRISAADVDFPIDVVLYFGPAAAWSSTVREGRPERIAGWQEGCASPCQSAIVLAGALLASIGQETDAPRQREPLSASELYEVEHVTRYQYQAAVPNRSHSPETSRRRLTARSPLTSKSTRRRQDSELVDLDGNSTCVAGSRAPRGLGIVTRSRVETLRRNPFDYVWDGRAKLPAAYPKDMTAALQPYLTRGAHAKVKALSEQVAGAVEGDGQRFLSSLAEALHGLVTQVVREEGPPLPPERRCAPAKGRAATSGAVRGRLPGQDSPPVS
jgi:hypothetical protein